LGKAGKEKTFKNIRKRSKTFKNIQILSGNVQKYLKIYKNVQLLSTHFCVSGIWYFVFGWGDLEEVYPGCGRTG
jgi:hypothetical protein